MFECLSVREAFKKRKEKKSKYKNDNFVERGMEGFCLTQAELDLYPLDPIKVYFSVVAHFVIIDHNS